MGVLEVVVPDGVQGGGDLGNMDYILCDDDLNGSTIWMLLQAVFQLLNVLPWCIIGTDIVFSICIEEF